jgi:hypothetical protein
MFFGCHRIQPLRKKIGIFDLADKATDIKSLPIDLENCFGLDSAEDRLSLSSTSAGYFPLERSQSSVFLIFTCPHDKRKNKLRDKIRKVLAIRIKLGNTVNSSLG